MTAADVQSYTLAGYDYCAVDSMHDIDVVNSRLQNMNGFTAIKTLIRDIFMKQGVNETFGIGLLHKHYDLAPNEIIEFGAVSSPWVIGNDEEITGGSVFPHMWRVYEGQVKPTEFKFVPQKEVSDYVRPVFPAAFVKEITQVLETTGLDDILGINLIERNEHDHETMKLTYGRSSIIIPTTQMKDGIILGPNDSQGLQGFQAAWSFTQKDSQVEAMHFNCSKAVNMEY